MMLRPGVAPRWQPDERDIGPIADAFGLDVISGPIRLLGGAVNGVVLVQTSSGDVVFRIHRPWTTVDRLEGVHRVQEQLRNARLPIPPVLATPQGTTWTWHHDRLVEALPFVGDGHEADSVEEFTESFAMLGRLHRELLAIPPATVPAPVFSSYAEPATALAMLTATDPTFEIGGTYASYAEAAAIRQDVRRLYQRLNDERLRRPAVFPTWLIHADFLGKNVLFEDRRIVAILDFDRLAHRDRIIDLATSLSCAWSRLDRHLPAPSAVTDQQLRHLRRWLAAYVDEAPVPLSMEEVQALPFEMARVQLFPAADAGNLAAAGQIEAAIEQTRAVAWHLPRAWWLVENARAVSEAVNA